MQDTFVSLRVALCRDYLSLSQGSKTGYFLAELIQAGVKHSAIDDSVYGGRRAETCDGSVR